METKAREMKHGLMGYILFDLFQFRDIEALIPAYIDENLDTAVKLE
jgi:hypothetical protein